MRRIAEVASAGSPSTTVQRITSEAEASALAERLVSPERRWPVVVLTIATGYDEPFGDPEAIKDAVGDLAEVVLMPTGDASWAFSRAMPPATQVYGGAGRVYPIGHDWALDPRRSPVRFAYSLRERGRITNQLISDALQAALAAGLLEPRVRAQAEQQRSGHVQGIIGSRALITFDDMSVATVWEELTVPGVALDRLLVKGQSVAGRYDRVSRRLDLRTALRFTDVASALTAIKDAYQIGDVVLAEVAAAADDVITMRLLPDVVVEVGRDAATSNPNDRLSGLVSVGEVVACRLVGLEPLQLRLDDVDDEEAPRPAPCLLPGGPSWLRLPDTPPVVVAVMPQPTPSPAPVIRSEVPRQPTPLDLARRLAPSAQPTIADPGVPLPACEPDVVPGSNGRATRTALADELMGLRTRAAELEAEVTEATRSIEALQTRYRKADLARQQLVKQLKQIGADQPADKDAPLFLDPEEQFRYDVTCAWAQRVPAAEKAAKPLAAYALGPDFLDSVEQIEGVSRAKVVAVVVEVLTGQVQHIAGREMHRLRTGDAGSAYRSRDDGATCWRVALQRQTAAARRLHYWRTQDGYEFSRVVLHDDFLP